MKSAQRLTASMVGAPDRYSTVKSPEFVLNALRHQWLGHTVGKLGRREFWGYVLNALRHQWLGHRLGQVEHDRRRCAQRLTASMVGALDSLLWLG